MTVEIYKFAFKLVEDSLQAKFVHVNTISLPDRKDSETVCFPNPTPMDVTTFVDAINQKVLIVPQSDNNPMLLIDKAGKRAKYPLEPGLDAGFGPDRRQIVESVYLYNGKPVISVLGDGRGKSLYDSPTHHSTIPGYALIGRSGNGKYLLIARAADDTYWIVKVK